MIFAFPLPPQIPNSHELPGGFAPLSPPPGLCPGPAGDLKLSPDACQILSPQHQILDPPLQTVSLIYLILAKFLSSKGAYNVTPIENIKSEFSVAHQLSISFITTNFHETL